MIFRDWKMGVVVALLAGSVAVWGDDYLSIAHQARQSWPASTNLPITAIVPANDQVEEMILYFRQIGQPDYQRRVMYANDGHTFVAVIPDSARGGEGIEYYIDATSHSGVHKTVPDFFAAITPIQIKFKADLISDRVKLVWPDFSDTLTDSQPLFEFEFNEIGTLLAPDNVQIELDGHNLTSYATINGYGATVKSPELLSDGIHIIKVIERKGSSRETVFSKEFQFGTVKAVSNSVIHGSLEGQYSRLKSTAPASAFVSESDDQATFLVSGTHSGLDVNGNVVISSRENALYQPVNRYAFSISNASKSIMVNFGDTNPSFSELTVSGILSRGMDLAYSSNWADFRFNFGDTLRSSEGSSTEAVSGTFQQNMAAFQSTFKLGSWGTISPTIAKISDNEASILDPGGSQPRENYLSGVKSTVWLYDNQVELNAELAASLYYRDKTAEEAEVAGIPAIVKSAFPIKAGMTFDTATKFSVEMPISGTNFSAYFSKTGSGYQTLGNPGLRSDLQEYFLADKLYLFSKYMFISGSYKNAHNNLLKIAAITETSKSYKMTAGINFPNLPNLSGSAGLDENKNDASQDSQVVNNRIITVSGAVSNIGLSLWNFTNQVGINGSYTLFSDLSPAKLLSAYNQKSFTVNWRNQVIAQWITVVNGGVNIKFEPATSLTTTYYNGTVEVSDDLNWLNSIAVARFSATKGLSSNQSLNVLKFQPELSLTWNRDDTTQWVFRGRYLDFRDLVDSSNSYRENSYTVTGRLSF